MFHKLLYPILGPFVTWFVLDVQGLKDAVRPTPGPNEVGPYSVLTCKVNSRSIKSTTRDRSSLEPVNSLLRAGAPGPQAGRFRRDDRQLDEVGNIKTHRIRIDIIY